MKAHRLLVAVIGITFVTLTILIHVDTALGARDLIPRQVLFGNPDRAMARISPDGKQLAYLAPHNGVMNVWVAPVDDLERAKVVTDDKSTGISQYFWAYTNNQILYLQDNNGDEDFHLYSVNLETNKVQDLTPFENIRAQVNGVSHKFPTEVLVGINDRNQHWFHDIYRINIETGARKLLYENNQFVGFLADDNYNLRLALTFTPQSEVLLFKADQNADGGWAEMIKVQPLDALTTSPAGLDKTGQVFYMLDSRGRDTGALKTIDIESGETKTVFATDIADIDGIMMHPTEKNIQAVSYTYDREKYEILDESVRPDLEYLRGVQEGDIEVSSRTLDDSKWTVVYSVDDGPVRFYLYDRQSKKAEYLFCHRPELENVKLAKMNPVIIESRDGLKLVSYLTLPPEQDPENDGRPKTALPMVLLVHGGPWARDHWGYNALHQLFADRGYAVLSVNYRGSTGFGKKFINAANKQWAGKMHDDLIDAVNWAVNEKIAVKDKIAIMGGSYGGYATLVGLTFTPDTFACGVDIVGPSSLISLMENPPPYWMPIMPMMKDRVGDWTTDEGRRALEKVSPLFHVDQIRRPLLIGQGAQDPRVKQSESDQIVAAMKQKNIPVTYMLYPEEGHGFDRPENNISFFAVSEAFLAEHLGGRYQPIGDDFKGAKFEVPAGADEVPGLEKTGSH